MVKEIVCYFGVRQKVTYVSCDSQSAIHLVKHRVYHMRTKHIYFRYYFIGDVVEEGRVILKKLTQRRIPHSC